MSAAAPPPPSHPSPKIGGNLKQKIRKRLFRQKLKICIQKSDGEKLIICSDLGVSESSLAEREGFWVCTVEVGIAPPHSVCTQNRRPFLQFQIFYVNLREREREIF